MIYLRVGMCSVIIEVKVLSSNEKPLYYLSERVNNNRRDKTVSLRNSLRDGGKQCNCLNSPHLHAIWKLFWTNGHALTCYINLMVCLCKNWLNFSYIVRKLI